jgi:uncharacterized protein with von Willebrand factor type A (vWA) domain
MSTNIRERISLKGREGAVLSAEEVVELDNELANVIADIKASSSYSAAAQSLDELGTLQEVLALLLFKYDAPLSTRQRAVVRRFDRSDDPDLRAAIYKAAKEGRFP